MVEIIIRPLVIHQNKCIANRYGLPALIVALLYWLSCSAVNSFVVVPKKHFVSSIPLFHDGVTKKESSSCLRQSKTNSIRVVALKSSSLIMDCDRKQISTTVIENNDEPLGLWEEQFLKRFQGDFDNYDQVLEDRQNGLLPREGGGHENIHCTLLPVSTAKDIGNNNNSDDNNLIGRVMAAFYFNGIPQQIFRLRLYTLYRHNNNNNNNNNNNDNKCVRMVLATFEPTLERELKAMQFHQWSSFLQDQLYNTKNEGKKSWEDLMVPLENCDVRWTETPDPQQHAYAYNGNINPMDAYHAVMVSGPNGTIVPSQMDPNILINIRDELSLWENEFWINDRGLDPNDPSNFIYGNQRGIPYKLKRVTNIQKKNNNSQSRIIVNPQLGWTLGPDHRTELFYEQKMAATQKNYTST